MIDSISEKPSSTSIQPPPDFPVQWEDDFEPTLLWSWDDFHNPLPPTAMSSAVGKLTSAGMRQANIESGTYRPGGRSKVINGYPYRASTAPAMTDEEKLERASTLEHEIETVRSNWDSKWMPELEANLGAMKTVRYDELDPVELWRTVERALRLHSRHWIIHHKIVVPVIEQSNRLETICSQILEPLGQSGDSLAHVLLHSDETMTVRSINQLELLAEEARRDPEVQLVLERDADAGQTLLALEGSEQGRDWRVALDSYLHDFGYRCTGFDLSFATWVEDQSFVFQIIRGLLSAAPAEGVAVHSQGQARERALTDERDALIEQVREAAVGKPELLNEFNTAYALAQRLWPLKEDHSHYIDQGSMAMVRIVLAEVGRRLEANGAIEHSNDVWYLDLDEAKTALIAEVPQGLKELVAERGADRERFSKLTPPKHLGTFPPDHDSVEEEVEPVESRGTLRGTAASKGEVTGIARVVMSPDDFHKVRQGDVLVCRSAAPMWTPLFRVISALVSESGGVLSHPAVVAREFNLPAVVGVRFATSRITDGQPVTVSGTDGLVHAG